MVSQGGLPVQRACTTVREPHRGPCLTLHLTTRGNDQQMIFHDEADRTDFLTRLGQEVL